MAFALGSFVGGLFEGAKDTADLIATKRKMDDAQAVRDEVEKARQEANKNVDEEKAARANLTSIPLADYGGGGDTGTTPAAPTEIKEGITGTRDPKALNPGAPELWDKIHPLITKYESGDRPNIGYGETDLTGVPSKPGLYGFPDWKGNQGPAGISHAAGVFQIEPAKWVEYAPKVGVNDFTLPSQYKVAQAMYLAEGLRPWAPYNPTLRDELAKAGLFGGAATSAARAGAPEAVPSALTGTPAPKTPGGTGAPDMEGQPTKTQYPEIQRTPNTATAVLRNILEGGTQRQQANVPEGATVLPPGPWAPLPVTGAVAPTPITRSVAADPVATSMATSALGGSSPAVAPSTTPIVTPTPSPRPVLSQLRQFQTGPSPFPPDQRFNSRGEAIASDLAPVSRSAQRGFAGANKIIRLPNGTMVDGLGNVVRQPQSALYPGG